MIVIRRVSPFRVAMESQRIGLGGLQKFLDTSKGSSEKIRGGGSENLYTSKPTGEGGGLLKN